jgi:hypothetical protein
MESVVGENLKMESDCVAPESMSATTREEEKKVILFLIREVSVESDSMCV